MLGRFRDPIWRAIVLVVSLVEVPRFLLRNRAIFRNRMLMPFWHWSFGHAITGIDYASRLYWPHRISLLYIPHPSSNPYLPRLFSHNVDVFTLESSLSFRSVRIDKPRFVVLRLFALLLAGVRLRDAKFLVPMASKPDIMRLTKSRTQRTRYTSWLQRRSRIACRRIEIR